MFYIIIIITHCLDWKYVNRMPQVQNSRCAWEECIWQYFRNRILHMSINQTCESCYPYLPFCCYSVTWLCPTLCDPIDCITPGFPFLHHLQSLLKCIHWVGDSIQPSHSVIPFSSWLQSFTASETFQMSWLFPSGSQNIGASVLASVLPMNIQD